jgi:hypothetical protein
MKKFILVGVAGILTLGVLCNSRHGILHFRLRFVSHTVESITPSPGYWGLSEGSAGKITTIVRYQGNDQEEIGSNLTGSTPPSGMIAHQLQKKNA